MLENRFIELPGGQNESGIKLHPNREFRIGANLTVTDAWRRKAEGQRIICDF